MGIVKKALLFRHRKNYLDIELEIAFAYGLEMAGFEVDVVDIDDLANKIDNFNIEQYDMIAFDVQSNSLFSAGRRRAYMFEQIFERAKDGAITMYACDVKMNFQPHLWDKGEDHKGPNIRKRNVFNGKPVKILASLHPSILNNEKDLEKANKIWNNKLHEDSTIHFIEWISFAVHTYGNNIGQVGLYLGDKIRYFYYGMTRSTIAKSLERNGLIDERDLVYGSIGRNLKNSSVRKVDIRVKEPFSWLKYVDHADHIIVPYEPLKSDYQITLRLLEAMMFYKDKAVFDDKINKNIVEFAKDKQLWYDKAEECAREIEKLY